jgi:transposase
MAITLPDARGLSDEVLEALRLRAVNGCALGFRETDVAELLGVARETVCRWWAAYSAGGLDTLPQQRRGRPVGSGRLLTEEQGRYLQDLIDHHSPEALGIAAPLWTRRAVRDLIRQEFDLNLAERTVGQYLERWGYTAKRPRRHARQQDPDEVRHWLEETYPAIEQRAQEEQAEILWYDEMGAAADAHPRYGYARQGEPATLEVPDKHIRMNQIAAISNEGDVHFMTYARTMNAALFLVFLEQLLRETSQKIFLIGDRLKAHMDTTVEEWVAAHQDRIELFYLPPYAPERNPEEYLNNDLKGTVNATGLPHNQEELRSHLEAFMSKLLYWPEKVRSYFQHPCVQYAAGT